MPTAIDEQKFDAQETLDMSRPQGTPHGLPVKSIPHHEYPRCVYKHPLEPYREVVHRNANHEVVHRELVATEHKTHVCHDREEFEKKTAEGWKTQPYIPLAPPDPEDGVYQKANREKK